MSEAHPIIRAWIAQLTHPRFQRKIEALSGDRIDVILFADGGQAKKAPQLRVEVKME
jgi:hypothetical protein